MRITPTQRAEVLARLVGLGITTEDAEKLRRISHTLRRWFELECGDGHGHIERIERRSPPSNSGGRHDLYP